MKSRFKLTLFFFLMLKLSQGQGQSTKSHDLRLGLEVSPSISWLSIKSGYSGQSGSLIGFNYGLMGDFYFTDNYSFSTGLTISYQGATLQDEGDKESVNYRIEYFQIPLTLKMRTNRIGPVHYFGKAGLVPGVRVGEKPANPIALALLIGAGVEIPFSGKTSFIAGISFHNGITDVIKGETEANANSLVLNLGVLF